MADDECRSALTNIDEAATFLEVFNNKKHPKHIKAMRSLDKWKRVASESHKDFFKKKMIKHLFEDGEAYDGFKEVVERGLNPLSNTSEEAKAKTDARES